MRHIYVQEKITTRILMMHQSRKEIGHRIPFTYMHMIPILRFLHHLYGDFSFKLYIFSQIYIYIQTYSTIASITNIFIKQSIILGRVVKI